MTEISKKRILFVDDEPLVLKGLQRTLRKRRAEWDTAFASSGKEALEILDQQSMDVIVSDLKMPEMDGMQLLAEVKAMFHSVRILRKVRCKPFSTMGSSSTNNICFLAI